MTWQIFPRVRLFRSWTGISWGRTMPKRAVAIALRNRWRRLRLEPALREEVIPKNILMIGPTGVGKTEIARRLARLANAPFLKVEATKFTEVGYVGRDVEQIVRDLMEVAILQVRTQRRQDVRAKAQLNAEGRVLDALVGANASAATRDSFRKKLRSGELDERGDRDSGCGYGSVAAVPGSAGDAGLFHRNGQHLGLSRPGIRRENETEADECQG